LDNHIFPPLIVFVIGFEFSALILLYLNTLKSQQETPSINLLSAEI